MWTRASGSATTRDLAAVTRNETVRNPLGRHAGARWSTTRPSPSRSAAVNYLNKLIVAELTSTIRNIPQEVHVGVSEGLSHPSVVNFDNVHVVAKNQLGELVGALDASREREVKRALGYALNWSELKVL